MMGAHQKIDRVARRNLRSIAPRVNFPDIKSILHFEGRNGPDGVKSKSPGVDEPWHYIDPTNPEDTAIYNLASDHIENLATALLERNHSRASFEAAWLAHTIVDGLTPAHHYPLADKIEELWGKPHYERATISEKNIIRGATRRDSLRKNWQYWGAKGVFTTHFMFEFGFATTISSLRFAGLAPSMTDKKRIENGEFKALFTEAVHEVYAHHLYEDYYKKGWTARLARESREFLAPKIINLVTLSWYAAVCEAEKRRNDA